VEDVEYVLGSDSSCRSSFAHTRFWCSKCFSVYLRRQTIAVEGESTGIQEDIRAGGRVVDVHHEDVSPDIHHPGTTYRTIVWLLPSIVLNFQIRRRLASDVCEEGVIINLFELHMTIFAHSDCVVWLVAAASRVIQY